MKLYNSETRQIEQFVPKNENNVTMYTCGPTVYNFAHIGNLRTYISEDILEKSLNYLGYGVKRAMNITDVGHLSSDGDTGDDKMTTGAKRENKTVMEIAKFYTDAFNNDFKKLNLDWPKIVVPASSYINVYIDIISKLMKNGFAYISGSNVYFDTSKLDKYYRLTNQGSEDLISAVREGVELDENKKNKNDFVLWFTKSKFQNQELKWDSPWGIGYPGWHIECSGISYVNLGEYLDIHCGGVDNKFPHHTNEIAQTESLIGHKWCNYWVHAEHLLCSSGKMSKSSGEFLTLSLLEKKGYNALDYKLFCLQSHYRKQLVFSYEGLNSAKATLNKIYDKLRQLNKNDGHINQQIYDDFNNQFKSSLANDLNTSLAITTIFDVLKSDVNDNTKISLISNFDKVLGLGFNEVLNENKENSIDEKLKEYIESMIEKRFQAKQNKNYTLADEIRKELSEKGITITDTKEGTEYKIN